MGLISWIYSWFSKPVVEIKNKNEKEVARMKAIDKLQNWATKLKKKKELRKNYDDCDKPIKVEDVIKDLEKETLEHEKKSYNLRKRNKKKKA